ncbi:hypothetical protein [Alkalihalobacterium elongatum]|uniref:hypothetical protein n=1 Tax=Alkalihalobacterium elongatum TaxID=2675466 RepID=UPI001C1F7BDB|nr:hypothetical protein [Alkalihalobacterium elongatum]
MKLNKTQKNFRAQMEQLKREGYYPEDEIYSTVRKRNFITRKTVGVSSFLLFILLLYPIYGILSTTDNYFTAGKHRGVINYLEKSFKYETQFHIALNDVMNNIPPKTTSMNDFLLKVNQYENDLKSAYEQSLKIKKPAVLEYYDQEFTYRCQHTLTLLYILKTSAQTNNFNYDQINMIVDEINFSYTKGQIILRTALEQMDMNYSVDETGVITYIEYLRF